MVGSSDQLCGGKVAIVSATFAPITGGMAQATYYHAALLSQYGHDVTLFTQSGFSDSNSQMNFDKQFSFRITRLDPVYSKGFAAYTPQLKSLLKGFDCILLEYPAYGLAEASYKASKVYGIPLLMYYHMDNVADGVKGTVFRIYKKLFLPKILRHSSEILVSSIEYAESSNLAPYMKEISGKISVAPLGVDTHRFYQAGKKPELLRRHNIKQTETIIGFVGGLDTAHYFKGVPVLLQAIKKLKNYHPNVPFRCIIAGAGDLRDPYIKRSQELGVIDNVLFPGRISEGELAQYYQLFDLFVLPSIDSSEAFGLVILEAMATATPVVVSNLPGPASLVQNEETGFVVPPSDVDRLATALFKLLKDPYLRAEMGNKAHSVIKEKYQWQNVGKKLHECVSKYSK